MIANLRQNTVRSATNEDRSRLASLIHFETKVHRHLDWRPPLDWVGQEPYLVVEQDEQLLAALACPPDPPNVAWIRLFAVSSGITASRAWEELWPVALSHLDGRVRAISLAAIPLQNWFRKLLEGSNFVHMYNVMVLNWRDGPIPPVRASAFDMVRPMNFDDLSAVVEIDSTAFGPVWQNSLSCLEIAYRQAAIATVAEIEGEIVGYQISTATAMGAHLARLAVKPAIQGRGIGYALVSDMISQFRRRGIVHITVNTQHDNFTSLSLYQKAGFHSTGEEYPVYQYAIV